MSKLCEKPLLLSGSATTWANSNMDSNEKEDLKFITTTGKPLI